MLMSSGAEPAMGYPDEATQRLKSLAGGASLEHLVRALKGFADADLRRDSSSPLPLELALVQSSLAAELEVAPANPGNNPVEPRRPERSQAPRAPRPVRPPAQRNDVAKRQRAPSRRGRAERPQGPAVGALAAAGDAVGRDPQVAKAVQGQALQPGRAAPGLQGAGGSGRHDHAEVLVPLPHGAHGGRAGRPARPARPAGDFGQSHGQPL